MKKRIWKDRDFWRTVSFKEFRDSREWRYLLDLNPSYDIRFRPAAGVSIHTRGYVGAGRRAPSGANTPGLLRAPDMNLGVLLDPETTIGDSLEASYFPWDSKAEYMERLGSYTAQAIFGRDRCNGFSLDSPQALSDTQRNLS